MRKAIFSKHIPLSSLPDNGETIISDIKLFNLIKRRAVSAINKELHKKKGCSLQLMLKAEFGLNDYFINSARQEAEQAISSVEELRKLNLFNLEQKIEQMDKKITKNQKRLEALKAEKESLIARSKARKEGRRLPPFASPRSGWERVDEEGRVLVGPKKKPRMVFDNEYLFELTYLDPKIKQIKQSIRNISQRRVKTYKKIDAMCPKKTKDDDDEKQTCSICFGTKKFFRAQNSVYLDGEIGKDTARKDGEKHQVWHKQFIKRRESSMIISGRKDAFGGNFVFNYNPYLHILTYKSMHGKVISVKVEFPHGQDLVDKACSASLKAKDAWEKQAIGWGVEIWGGSLIFKCLFDEPESRRNVCTDTGVVGMDINVDCLALADIDKDGNMVGHKTIPFSLEGKSSGQNEHILSQALEEAFQYVIERKKPIAIEDIHDVKKLSLYQDKDMNRTLHMFAYSQMRWLAESKAQKYCIGLFIVNPCYTSQIGKVKYMRRYGVPVHEAAAMAIARRSMGFKERIPSTMRHLLPVAKRHKHHWSHWSALYKGLKELPWRECYRYMDYTQVRKINKLKDLLPSEEFNAA